MALFKKINGKRVQMSVIEEQETRDAWIANDTKQKQKQDLKKQEQVEKKTKLEFLREKLALTQEEFNLIKNS